MTTEKASNFKVNHFYHLKNKSKNEEFFAVKILEKTEKNINVLILSNGIEKVFFEDDILNYARPISLNEELAKLIGFQKIGYRYIQFKLHKETVYVCFLYENTKHSIIHIIKDQKNFIHKQLIIEKSKDNSEINSYEDLKCQGKLFESVEELFGILNNEYGYDINPIEIVKKLND